MNGETRQEDKKRKTTCQGGDTATLVVYLGERVVGDAQLHVDEERQVGEEVQELKARLVVFAHQRIFDVVHDVLLNAARGAEDVEVLPVHGARLFGAVCQVEKVARLADLVLEPFPASVVHFAEAVVEDVLQVGLDPQESTKGMGVC